MRQIIDQVKNLDFENKNLHSEITTLENAYDEKLKDITGQGHLVKLKAQLKELKAQTKEFSLNEGVMACTLFSCNGMRNGNHHLYDDLNEGEDNIELEES